MTLGNSSRTFFIHYNNGDTFYFDLKPNWEIYCTKFKNIYESIKGIAMPPAHVLEFKGNNFCLKDISGNIIYSLEEYRKYISELSHIQEEATIVRLYIDEDTRTDLLGKEMLKYDEEAANIPGLLYEPIEETQCASVKRRRLINN